MDEEEWITGEWVRGYLDRLNCISRNTLIEGRVCRGWNWDFERLRPSIL
jgi:hypothetical protein